MEKTVQDWQTGSVVYKDENSIAMPSLVIADGQTEMCLVLTDSVETFNAGHITIHRASNQQIVKPIVVIDLVLTVLLIVL
jgi:hypothetical protein